MGTIAGLVTVLSAWFGIANYDHAFAAFVVVGMLAALILESKQSVIDTMSNRTRTLRALLERVRRDLGDVHGMVRLGHYSQRLPMPFGGGWALTGDSAALLAHETILRNPRLIVELGSGVSTLILGQILAKNGEGKLISLDHDVEWAARTQKNIDALGLSHVVEVVHAPLAPMKMEEGTFLWYSTESDLINQLKNIDILLIDGPPRTANQDRPDQGHAARYPAFSFFWEKMSPDAIIFVDDANRRGEREMIKHWLGHDSEWQVRWYDTVDGMATLSRDDRS
ncbi:O-methyltransferase [Seongchinamella sediminis]|uniref:O-methyltransferase n=1 Tax=Seongchinamella sediminis TaxID=2283635 RepID=UPI0013C2A83A|nr:class I SAM-dependent methyltransferase [Seongchinamella sediminis]